MTRKTGPAPAPTVVKLDRSPGGKLRKRDRNSREPRGDILATLPPASPVIEAVEGAGEIWEEYGRRLIKAQILTALDLAALEQFAVWRAKWIWTEKALSGDSLVLSSAEGGLYQNPLVSIAKQCAQMCDKWGALLGLSPSDRTRLKVAPPEKPDGFLDD